MHQPTVRHRTFHPSIITAVTPNAGTIDRIPPTSDPQNGAPSTTTTTASSPTPIQVPRLSPMRCASSGAARTVDAATTAYAGFEKPVKRPATVGEYPSALLNWSGVPTRTSMSSNTTGNSSAMSNASRYRSRAMRR
ncbi:MAG: hypothetical protein WEC34_00075 [Acidimicrobiia bacterium]